MPLTVRGGRTGNNKYEDRKTRTREFKGSNREKNLRGRAAKNLWHSRFLAVRPLSSQCQRKPLHVDRIRGIDPGEGGTILLIYFRDGTLDSLDILNELTGHLLAVAIQHSCLVQEEQRVLNA